MISYSLAKELKENGYPQQYTDRYWLITTHGVWNNVEKEFFDRIGHSPMDYVNMGEAVAIPTLSELILECDKKCHSLAIFSDGDGWRCGDYMPYEHDWVVRIENKDLDTAMALLWLELNKK